MNGGPRGAPQGGELERTLVLLKPDAVRRGLVGAVLSRLERRGLRVVALRTVPPARVQVEELYRGWKDRGFFRELVAFVASGPVVAAVVEGPRAVSIVRAMVGRTDPLASAPGTVRGDLASSFPENVIHASHGPAEAAREIPLFFPGPPPQRPEPDDRTAP